MSIELQDLRLEETVAAETVFLAMRREQIS